MCRLCAHTVKPVACPCLVVCAVLSWHMRLEVVSVSGFTTITQNCVQGPTAKNQNWLIGSRHHIFNSFVSKVVGIQFYGWSGNSILWKLKRTYICPGLSTRWTRHLRINIDLVITLWVFTMTQRQNTNVCNGKFRSFRDRKDVHVKIKCQEHLCRTGLKQKESSIINFFLQRKQSTKHYPLNFWNLCHSASVERDQVFDLTSQFCSATNGPPHTTF
jgi:hypothetical protein